MQSTKPKVSKVNFVIVITTQTSKQVHSGAGPKSVTFYNSSIPWSWCSFSVCSTNITASSKVSGINVCIQAKAFTLVRQLSQNSCKAKKLKNWKIHRISVSVFENTNPHSCHFQNLWKRDGEIEKETESETGRVVGFR